jgi:hypothetical protein
MYSLAWAESIYSEHWKSCTRAEQIRRCIQQLAPKYGTYYLSTEQLSHILVLSLAGKHNKKLWPAYKRLCKKTPFDVDLLKEVTKMVIGVQVDEFCQLQMEF